MRLVSMTSVAIVLALACLAAMSYASDERQTYIIHMDKTKITELEHQSSLKNPPKRWYDIVLDSVMKSSHQSGLASPPELIYAYETTMTGFAALLTSSQFELVNSIEGVLLAVPDKMLSLHTTYSSRFLGLEQGRGLWNSTLASGVVIGVLDTGIWPEHASFHDSGLPPIPSRWKGGCEEGTNFTSSNCNRKIVGGRAFFKGYEAINGRINETEDYRSARDSNGHGTHTASTAAGRMVTDASLFGLAEGIASGMSYTSRIAAYKVCWRGGCAGADILAAIDKAVTDGVDVLSLSLGGLPRPYYNDSMAIALLGAVQHGVFVSCSAGNSGPTRSTVGNMAPWIMTVAASYLDRTFPTKIKLGNGKTLKGASLYNGQRRTKQLPLVYKETAGVTGAEFCISGSLNSKSVKGKIVACERGINSRTEKGQIVKIAGGAGMLLLNNANQGEDLLADAHVLPATTVGVKAASAIKSYLTLSGNLTVSIKFKGTTYGDRAPVMAAFSSRGPNLVDPNVIKPDITAPGVNILAAWPPVTSPTELKTDKRRVLFNIVSGTSMSCPHLSGIAALIKSIHQDWSPAAIKSAIMTTSYTRDNTNGPITDAFSPNKITYATPFAFGSGHVDPEKASDPGLVFDIGHEDYLNYLCTLNYTTTQLALVSRGNFTCPKGTDDLKPGDLNYPSFAVVFLGNGKTTKLTYKRTVTNVGKAKCIYKVIVNEPLGVSITVVPRVLKFSKVGQKITFRVTFSGLGGSEVTFGSWSFGSLTWVSGVYSVRSPVAATWQQGSSVVIH